MSWKPTTSQKTRQLRAQMLHDIREFFLARRVLEVETPALSHAGNTDPFIESITTLSSTSPHYLHTSPEYAMKRLLAAGSGDIYQICKVWRAGESGKNHNPEFSMLEWYRVGFSYHQLIIEVAELLTYLLPNIHKKHHTISYEQLFLDTFGINPHLDKYGEIASCVKKNIKGLNTKNLNQQAMLDALLTHCIEPDFDKSALTFVVDYPAKQSALAKIRQEKSYNIAERFEVYLGENELGNGYQEEVSYPRNQAILQNENNHRQELGLKKITKDNNFLNALQSGLPESSGVAIGVDRILMSLAGVENIQEVINFPWEIA